MIWKREIIPFEFVENDRGKLVSLHVFLKEREELNELKFENFQDRGKGNF